MHLVFLLFLSLSLSLSAIAQEYGEPDTKSPGDAMIQQYLRHEALRLETNFLQEIKTEEDWAKARPRFRKEYLDMLGLWPLPETTPLHHNITRTIDRGDYQVDCLHYQSRPGLYVTANLYRPAKIEPGQKLPAILYVCGHSGRGRNGNKTAFQSHGIWLARHGYICLMVDTLQLGEIAGIHHGTYREGRWWWLSRGYTPAGVECWNGVRGIDYLLSRPDVDSNRIGVTGISGGGAATFWVAAADERVKVAIPVSGMADLASYIPNRVINGHCDCMFLYNTYQWHWTRIAGMIAPRPMLFMNSDEDPIFPMDANDRIITRLERLYSLFGASDRVDAFVSIGGHDYRKDIREASFRFLNTWLKNDPKPVEDTEVDLVPDGRDPAHPIPPEELRAFPTDSDIPRDALNARIDEEFVPIGRLALENIEQARREIIAKLRRLTFNHFPERIPAAAVSANATDGTLTTEQNISIQLHGPMGKEATPKKRIVLILSDGTGMFFSPLSGDVMFAFEPRGLGQSKWTTRNPPNYVERSHYLLGRTPDSGRVWDIAATARFLKAKHPDLPVVVAAEKSLALLAIYAALLEPDISRVVAKNLPSSLMDPGAPVLLNALRVCDVPDLLKSLPAGLLEEIR